jgi:protein-L-isoaspartate O-methyltransferase
LERLATLKGIPKKMLVWGLGAGVFARALAEAGTEVTVLEIDPASEKVARSHFGLPPQVKVIIGDARTETLNLPEQYDLIVLDAFSGDTPPFHLLTKEAFDGLKTKLAPGGVVLANIVGGVQGEEGRVVCSVVKTMELVFGKTEIFSVNRKIAAEVDSSKDNPRFVSTNFLFHGEIPAEVTPFTLPYPKEMQKYLDKVLSSRVTDLARNEGVILTDAYAPLEAWSDAAVKAMR